MAIYHLSAKIISRKAGRSSTAAAAYRSGVLLVDERTGEVHDYSRKKGVEHSQVVMPTGSEWQPDRANLWNAVETKNKRADAQVAREFVVAIPSELSFADREKLVMGFARDLADRYQIACDVAIHSPSREGDQRNHHAHILTTTNRIEGQGLGNKVRELDQIARAKAGPEQVNEIERVREVWAEQVNAALERAQVQERVDHRSHERRGIETAPTVHLGLAAAAMERRGIETERGGINRMVVVANQALHHARQLVEQAAARAKESASQVMGRGARIMAELAQTDTAKLDEALQIRQAEKILQERQRQRQQEQARGRKPGRIRTSDRGPGGPEFGI